MRAPRERSTAGHTSPAHVRAEHCSWGREAPQDTRAQHMCVQSSAAGREKHRNTNEPSTSARAKYCGLKKVLRLEERSTAGHTNTHHARWCNLLLKGRLVHFEFMPQGVLVHATLIRQDGCINEGLQDSPRKQHSAGGRSTGCAAATKPAQGKLVPDSKALHEQASTPKKSNHTYANCVGAAGCCPGLWVRVDRAAQHQQTPSPAGHLSSWC